MISRQQQSAITAAWEKRVATLETTKLGGGIGFHGWIREWDNSGPRHLSWGCVVMHLFDIQKLYDQIPEGDDGRDPVTEIQLKSTKRQPD